MYLLVFEILIIKEINCFCISFLKMLYTVKMRLSHFFAFCTEDGLSGLVTCYEPTEGWKFQYFWLLVGNDRYFRTHIGRSLIY